MADQKEMERLKALPHASARHVRVTPMKARRMVDLIRGRQADEALAILRFSPQAASEPVYKVLASAVANARVSAERESKRLDVEDLVIRKAYVDEGPTLKRFRPRAQGRAFRVRKRTSHITVIVEPREDAEQTEVRRKRLQRNKPKTDDTAAPKKKTTASKRSASKTAATKTAASTPPKKQAAKPAAEPTTADEAQSKGRTR